MLEGWYRDEDECGACLLILEKQWIALKKGLIQVTVLCAWKVLKNGRLR